MNTMASFENWRYRRGGGTRATEILGKRCLFKEGERERDRTGEICIFLVLAMFARPRHPSYIYHI